MVDRTRSAPAVTVTEAPGPAAERAVRFSQSRLWLGLASRWRRGPIRNGHLVFLIVAVFAAGLLGGRLWESEGGIDGLAVIEASVIPLVLDADGIWTSPSGDRPPIAEGLVSLRRDALAAPVQDHAAEWLAAYDTVLIQLAGIDLPATARPVLRQFIAAVVLSRDAVEVLAYAAEVEDPDLRQALTTEVGRLRQRGEQLTQSARASLVDLAGGRADVAPPVSLNSFEQGLP